ncbi:MAG: hypothetical protein Q8S54_03085 [Bacteroidota bacterium]|nr:hypothetical protein [Odoribacter sp.]MDP3642157.1 hypothetical protein [Bacteroidota bacterium]
MNLRLFTLAITFIFSIAIHKTIAQSTDQFPITDNIENKSDLIRLKNKIIPLTNTVYQVLDYFEAKGELRFLPQAKPYTKVFIAHILTKLLEKENLSDREKKMVSRYLSDITQDSNGLVAYKQAGKNTFALAGFSAETSLRTGAGDHGTWSTSLIGEPYLSGDLGEHLTFTAAMGLAVERLTPDLFYQSYTRDKQVAFPNESLGYSYLPYQFNFETMWAHVLAEGTSGEGKPIQDKLTAGMIYHTELSGSWFEGAVQFSINNQRRTWGHDQNNLVLSSTARKFPGIELKIQPASWVRYSYLTGSLFSYANQSANYRKQIYGYDLGQVQKMFTYHLLEFTPNKWLQISAAGGNIWSKRLELAYLVPFVLPHFTQIDVGDHDNLSLYFDVAIQIPQIGKAWTGLYVDEFNFTKSGKLMKMPHNRYAWQLGWKTSALSGIVPGTTSTLKYTRLTPFVYTHYPETDFNTFGSNRPLDMTYTHDEFNLGFYLPPNSGELNWKLENIAVEDLVLILDNRLIIHGTNDLASNNIYQIYGDIYRHQMVETTSIDLYKYPLLNFTKDGIYDWTVESEFKFDWKIRNASSINYYRLVGSLGYSKTWWKSNASGITAPESKTLFTGSIGIVVEM